MKKPAFLTSTTTFGSWLVQSGVPLLAVSGLLRHSNINVTAHLNTNEYRAPAKVLDEPPKLGS